MNFHLAKVFLNNKVTPPYDGIVFVRALTPPWAVVLRTKTKSPFLGAKELSALTGQVEGERFSMGKRTYLGRVCLGLLTP